MNSKCSVALIAINLSVFCFLGGRANAALIFTDKGGTLQFELTESVTFPSLYWNNVGLTTGYTGSGLVDLNSFNFIGTPWGSVTSDGSLVTNGSWTLLAGRIGSSVVFNTRFRQSEGNVFLPKGVYETATPYSDYNVNVESVALGTWDGSDLVGASSPIDVVPEASSVLLLGLGAFGFVKRRRKNCSVELVEAQ